MDRSLRRRKQNNRFVPQTEPVEGRLLLSLGGVVTGALGPKGFLNNPPGTQLVRPNTPVSPFAATLNAATFVDPSVHIIHGAHIVVGFQSYVAPFATLDATTGFIKIGSRSDVQDNATIVSNPDNLTAYPTSVRIGDLVSIGAGARVLGPSVIGGYGKAAAPTGVGPNAEIDGATISPGAYVGTLARVGPGVTIPAGYYVKPGSNVTTNAEATDPALGMVQKTIPASTFTALASALTRYPALAAGYTNLYEGSSATGLSIATTLLGINNGNLSVVEGASPEPGASTSTATTGIAFESASSSPAFIGPNRPSVMVNLFDFPARVIGQVQFGARADVVARYLGPSNSIRADQGQPISFATYPVTGRAVTISSPGGGITTTTTTATNFGVTSTTTKTTTTGTIKIGTNFYAGDHAVILGGTSPSYKIGDLVSVGPGAVVSNSSLGTGVTVGPRAYVSGSTIPAGTSVPAGAIIINNQPAGRVQW